MQIKEREEQTSSAGIFQRKINVSTLQTINFRQQHETAEMREMFHQKFHFPT